MLRDSYAASIIVMLMVILNRLSHTVQLNLLCVNTCETHCEVHYFVRGYAVPINIDDFHSRNLLMKK
jgi:hypothetical protein